MNEYKVVHDNKTELFLEPIPRWITSYGFLTMLVLAVLIVVSSYFFKIPRTLSTTVHLERQKAFTTLSFDESFLIRDTCTMIYIKVPLQSTPIIGKIRKSEIWAEGSKLYVPIFIDQAVLGALTFKNELDCSGEILIDNTSLFQKVFTSPVAN